VYVQQALLEASIALRGAREVSLVPDGQLTLQLDPGQLKLYTDVAAVDTGLENDLHLELYGVGRCVAEYRRQKREAAKAKRAQWSLSAVLRASTASGSLQSLQFMAEHKVLVLYASWQAVFGESSVGADAFNWKQACVDIE
jgi:hypothetical protein